MFLDTDKYGRLLRYVYIDPSTAESGDVFVNDYLVRQGFARIRHRPAGRSVLGICFRIPKGSSPTGEGLWGSCY